MSLELSPSQERRLHSILDRGLDTLHESVENISRSTPGKYNWCSNLEASYRDTSQKFINSPKQNEKSQIINSELKNLQEKLATLEAKLSKKPISSAKPLRGKAKSPANHQKYGSENSPRVQSAVSRHNASRERLKVIENSEKVIGKMERSITPSPARYKSTMKRIEKPRAASIKDKRNDEQKKSEEHRRGEDKIRKENEFLKKELSKMEEFKNLVNKLQEENNKLVLSFERSENIRKKQKELIIHLKNELRTFNEADLSDSLKVKQKKNKLK